MNEKLQVELPDRLGRRHYSTHQVLADHNLKASVFKLYEECFSSHDVAAENSTSNAEAADVINTENVVETLVGFFDKESCNWSFITLDYGIVAMVTTIEHESSYFIFNLATLPQYRGCGLASILVCDIAYAALLKGKALSGSVARENKFLLDFYRRMGAHEVETGLYGPNTTPPPSLRFQSNVTRSILQKKVLSTQRRIDFSFRNSSLTLGKTKTKYVLLLSAVVIIATFVSYRYRCIFRRFKFSGT